MKSLGSGSCQSSGTLRVRVLGTVFEKITHGIVWAVDNTLRLAYQVMRMNGDAWLARCVTRLIMKIGIPLYFSYDVFMI
ncbi:hypothetical protein L1987_83814 [Smallanthus sonchifolius]|uniref:Uncharacterized protein n=1 Tax=Smallanthus sonchifolius TaxID=185202 RepID=A0ACB8YD25_9ASTR|nr:hypothetical protein L1987_83814 [Smallanthus sonchifolius]